MKKKQASQIKMTATKARLRCEEEQKGKERDFSVLDNEQLRFLLYSGMYGVGAEAELKRRGLIAPLYEEPLQRV